MSTKTQKTEQRNFLIPIPNKLYLTIFLSLNIIGNDFFLGFFGFPSIASYDDIRWALFICLTLVGTYIFSCIATVKFPQFWRPARLKVFLAVLFEILLSGFFVLADLGSIITVFVSTMVTPMTTVQSNQPAFDTCPPGKFETLCASYSYSHILNIVIVLSTYLILITSYVLSCLVLYIIKLRRKGK